MREIKFRYFDTKRQEFITDCDVYFIDSNCILAGDFDNPPVVDITKDVVISQYTGLKDSKCNEIYEGDIVHVWEQDSFIPNRDSGGGIVDYDCVDGFSQLGVVSFKGAWYTYETKQHLEGREEQIYAPLDFTNDLVVVGNIYENADLIQGGRKMEYTQHGTYEVTQLLAEAKENEENGN
ncbi:YopX family protein [Bacillus pacificus]|uniref:YopX family protein n=1 Tax=Bacillus pacificus TaxID=2026187 RepID=UPI003D65C83C